MQNEGHKDCSARNNLSTESRAHEGYSPAWKRNAFGNENNMDYYDQTAKHHYPRTKPPKKEGMHNNMRPHEITGHDFKENLSMLESPPSKRYFAFDKDIDSISVEKHQSRRYDVGDFNVAMPSVSCFSYAPDMAGDRNQYLRHSVTGSQSHCGDKYLHPARLEKSSPRQYSNDLNRPKPKRLSDISTILEPSEIDCAMRECPIPCNEPTIWIPNFEPKMIPLSPVEYQDTDAHDEFKCDPSSKSPLSESCPQIFVCDKAPAVNSTDVSSDSSNSDNESIRHSSHRSRSSSVSSQRSSSSDSSSSSDCSTCSGSSDSEDDEATDASEPVKETANNDDCLDGDVITKPIEGSSSGDDSLYEGITTKPIEGSNSDDDGLYEGITTKPIEGSNSGDDSLYEGITTKPIEGSSSGEDSLHEGITTKPIEGSNSGDDSLYKGITTKPIEGSNSDDDGLYEGITTKAIEKTNDYENLYEDGLDTELGASHSDHMPETFPADAPADTPMDLPACIESRPGSSATPADQKIDGHLDTESICVDIGSPPEKEKGLDENHMADSNDTKAVKCDINDGTARDVDVESSPFKAETLEGAVLDDDKSFDYVNPAEEAFPCEVKRTPIRIKLDFKKPLLSVSTTSTPQVIGMDGETLLDADTQLRFTLLCNEHSKVKTEAVCNEIGLKCNPEPDVDSQQNGKINNTIIDSHQNDHEKQNQNQNEKYNEGGEIPIGETKSSRSPQRSDWQNTPARDERSRRYGSRYRARSRDRRPGNRYNKRWRSRSRSPTRTSQEPATTRTRLRFITRRSRSRSRHRSRSRTHRSSYRTRRSRSRSKTQRSRSRSRTRKSRSPSRSSCSNQNLYSRNRRSDPTEQGAKYSQYSRSSDCIDNHHHSSTSNLTAEENHQMHFDLARKSFGRWLDREENPQISSGDTKPVDEYEVYRQMYLSHWADYSYAKPNKVVHQQQSNVDEILDSAMNVESDEELPAPPGTCTPIKLLPATEEQGSCGQQIQVDTNNSNSSNDLLGVVNDDIEASKDLDLKQAVPVQLKLVDSNNTNTILTKTPPVVFGLHDEVDSPEETSMTAFPILGYSPDFQNSEKTVKTTELQPLIGKSDEMVDTKTMNDNDSNQQSLRTNTDIMPLDSSTDDVVLTNRSSSNAWDMNSQCISANKNCDTMVDNNCNFFNMDHSKDCDIKSSSDFHEASHGESNDPKLSKAGDNESVFEKLSVQEIPASPEKNVCEEQDKTATLPVISVPSDSLYDDMIDIAPESFLHVTEDNLLLDLSADTKQNDTVNNDDKADTPERDTQKVNDDDKADRPPAPEPYRQRRQERRRSRSRSRERKYHRDSKQGDEDDKYHRRREHRYHSHHLYRPSTYRESDPQVPRKDGRGSSYYQHPSWYQSKWNDYKVQSASGPQTIQTLWNSRNPTWDDRLPDMDSIDPAVFDLMKKEPPKDDQELGRLLIQQHSMDSTGSAPDGTCQSEEICPPGEERLQPNHHHSPMEKISQSSNVDYSKSHHSSGRRSRSSRGKESSSGSQSPRHRHHTHHRSRDRQPRERQSRDRQSRERRSTSRSRDSRSRHGRSRDHHSEADNSHVHRRSHRSRSKDRQKRTRDNLHKVSRSRSEDRSRSRNTERSGLRHDNKAENERYPVGYCFVEFPDTDEAHRAMLRLSGKMIPGSAPPKRFKLNKASFGREHLRDTEHSLFVGDLTEEVDDLMLYNAFHRRYKSLSAAKVVTDPTGYSRGYGFVRFSNSAEHAAALAEMDKFVGLGGKPIKVSRATPKSRQSSKDENSQYPSQNPGQYYPNYSHNYYNQSSWWQSYQTPANQYYQQSMDYTQQATVAQNQTTSDDELEDPELEIDVAKANAEFMERSEEVYMALEGSRWHPLDTVMSPISPSLQ